MKLNKRNLSLSKLQSPVTTRWLHENYEIEDGVSLPRSSLYTHYLDFCSKNNIVPVNAASFGKIIRTTFPDLKTRRLGTRGQSKYHYYGISVKKTSLYYEAVVPTQRQSVSGFSQTYIKSEGNPPPKKRTKTSNNSSKNNSTTSATSTTSIQQPATNTTNNINNNNSNNNKDNFNQMSASTTLLPEFPSDQTISTDDEVLRDKIKTFLIMYKAHCQRILDTILRANFTEVQNFLVHFWQGIPSHIQMILTHYAVVDLIGQCDNILYKAIGSVLIPSSLQPLPVSLTQAIQQFAKQLSGWLQVALFHLPEDLQRKKLSVAKSFSQQLCRQTSLAHVAQAARTVLTDGDVVSQMATDFQAIQLDMIVRQMLWLSSTPQHHARDEYMISKFLDEMFELLERQATLEEFTDWLSSLVMKCVVKPSEKDDVSFQGLAQDFLLKWSFISSKVIQELTLRSSKSFGSFHLLQMLFDDFIFYKIESHADISEEFEDCIPERAPSFTTRNKAWNTINDPSSYRNRASLSSVSSSERGNITPMPFRDSNFPVFSYNNDNNNSINNNNNTHHFHTEQTRNMTFPYDDPSRYVKYTQGTTYIPTEEIPPAGTSDIKENSGTTEEIYYSEDLELVRQLQERTKSLMDASRYDGRNEVYQYEPSYPPYDNMARDNTQTPIMTNIPVGHYTGNSYLI